MKQKRLIELSLWLVVLIWAGNYTIGKFGIRDFSPNIFTLLRFSIATPIMYGLLFWREGGLNYSREFLPRIVIIGIVGVALYQSMFMTALKYTTATTVALMLGISPISTAICGAITGQEKISSSVILGCFTSFIGLFMVIKFGYGELGLSMATLYGDFIAFAAGVLWGIYPILVTPILKKHSALWATSHTSLIGTICLLIYSWPEIGNIDWYAISIPAWVSLFYSAIPVTVIALILWYSGIEKIGSNQVMIYMYMITPVAIAIAALVIDERVNLLQGIGALIAMLGVYLVKKRPARDYAEKQ